MFWWNGSPFISFPGRLDLQLPQQVGIVFPIDSLSFLKAVNEHHALCIPEDKGHHLPCWWHHLVLLWRGRRGVFPLHGLPFGLWLEVLDPTLIEGEETFKKTDCICFKKWQVHLRLDQPGVLFDMPSSSCRMFSTRFGEMPTALATCIWWIVKRLSSTHSQCCLGWWLWQDVRTLGHLRGSPYPSRI